MGEFGAPILDINGQMSQDEQAKWITDALSKLAQTHYVIGINYWTNIGSSTALWNQDGTARKAVSAITTVYKTRVHSARK